MTDSGQLELGFVALVAGQVDGHAGQLENFAQAVAHPVQQLGLLDQAGDLLAEFLDQGGHVVAGVVKPLVQILSAAGPGRATGPRPRPGSIPAEAMVPLPGIKSRTLLPNHQVPPR